MRTYICEIRTEQNNIYIKRDDLFPFSFGGNKARKAVNFFKRLTTEISTRLSPMVAVVPITAV